MKAWLRHPLRVTFRLLWFAAELGLAGVTYAAHCGLGRKEPLPSRRATWLQQAARRMLRVLAVELKVSGTVPSRGLLVSNHLSYVDILVLGSVTRTVFVAKREVRGWPVLGWFASMAGTVFVQREKRTQAAQVVDEIEGALGGDALVVLFPEGTSSNGSTVLPFKSSLLEPATRRPEDLSAGRIQYELDDGDAGEEVCYWKDMTFFPHLLNLMGKRRVRATVRFTRLRQGSTDRKELARQLHEEVTRLKEAVAA
jgi:1-acyl-sn-glycerol-3-phosphate acyltransferase